MGRVILILMKFGISILHGFTDFRTVFAFAILPFLPLSVVSVSNISFYIVNYNVKLVVTDQKYGHGKERS